MSLPTGNEARDNPIRCCVCLNVNQGTSSRTPADTIINGYAVCDGHAEVLAHHDFNFQELIQSARSQRKTL